MSQAGPVRAMLERFAASLKPAPEVERQGNMLLDEIIRTIQKKTRFTIRRVAKTGSVGKNTAINVKLDYDCLFYIEADATRTESISAFLDEVDNILTLNFPDVAGKQTEHTDSFFYKGFYFDFLSCQHLDLDPEQQVKKAMQTNDENVKVCLSEGTVIFMKDQSSFVHQLSRLLKFWSHSVLVPGFFNGRSYTMELFAVLASEEEQEDLLRGFRLALHKIQHFRDVRKVWHRFYTQDEANQHASVGPLLLDPADPTNNLLESRRWPYFEKLAEYASCTLERLWCLEGGVSDLVVELFRPQPDIWHQMRFVPRTDTWLVGGEGQSTEYAQPFAILHRPVCPHGEMNVLAHMLHGMLVSRRFAILDAKAGASVTSAELQRFILADARCKLEQCINKTFGTVSWTPSSQRFEEKSVVLILPIGGDGNFIQAGFEVDHKQLAPMDQMEPFSHYWRRRRIPRMTAYSAR